MSTSPGLSRHESFPCEGPADLDLRLFEGRLDVRMVAEPVARVTLTTEASEPHAADRVLKETKVAWSANSGKLVVRTPRRAQVAVLIEVPDRSRLSVHAGSASVEVSGTAGRLDAHTGAGGVSAAAVDGPVEINSKSGDVRLGPVSGDVRYRAGSGRFEAASIEGQARIDTGSGDISLGAISSDVVARTGSGDVRVAEVSNGQVVVATGSGNVWIGLRQGVKAEIDLVSGSGSARTELDVADHAPAEEPAVRIKTRTGSGEAIVARAVG